MLNSTEKLSYSLQSSLQILLFKLCDTATVPTSTSQFIFYNNLKYK